MRKLENKHKRTQTLNIFFYNKAFRIAIQLHFISETSFYQTLIQYLIPRSIAIRSNYILENNLNFFNLPSKPSSFGGLQKDKSNDITAASCKMIRVTSCNASHTNSRNVFGGRGGIMLEPNTSRRCSKSPLSPLKPIRNKNIAVLSYYINMSCNVCLSEYWLEYDISNYIL